MEEGIVYVLTNPAMEGYVKIGQTSGNDAKAVVQRMRHLDVTGVPRAFNCEYAAVVENPKEVETALLIGFGENRVRANREFLEGIPPFRIKALLKLREKKDVTPNDGSLRNDGPAETGLEKPPKKPPFRFSMVDIRPGAVLYWAEDDAITCTVLDDRYIDYQGTKTTISAAAAKLKGWQSAQGSQYWLYEGETLQERRDRFEATEDDN